MTPICSTPQTLVASFDLLVALCRGCVQNLKVLADILTDFYYSGNCLNSLYFKFVRNAFGFLNIILTFELSSGTHTDKENSHFCSMLFYRRCNINFFITH